MEKTFGRLTILANYTEKQILKAAAKKDLSELDKIISEILANAQSIHEKNRQDTLYLQNYLYGDQDIKYKQKYTRDEINNKVVENWAYAIVDFKKTYLLGKPIQYVQLNDSGEEEISALNKYVRYEEKKAKDLELYEDVLSVGRGFRYINKDIEGAEDEAPFELINCPVADTEVVYSSRLGNEQLFSYIVTPMQYWSTYRDDNGIEVEGFVPYNEYTVYLRNMQLTYTDKGGSIVRKGSAIPLLWNEHIIVEYRLNKKRISLIEIGKDLFEGINNLESLDEDDFEQFVNAIMVFTNAEVSGEDLDEIKELGAVCINSTDQKKASVELLQQKMNAVDTQTFYNRLKTALFQILGVPIASDTGSISSGDTGKSKLVGQGFTSAGIRAEGDETMFGRCDRQALKVILTICKNSANSEVKTLICSDIDSKFQRDMSDNLLIKTQGLLNLYAADVPRKFANSIVNLFGDPNAVTKEQETLFGEQVSQQGKGANTGTQESEFTNNDDVADDQNNKINNANENQEQGQ